jgi:putative holliday junction resolvase
LDIGSKRIGIAVSDELGFTAQGLTTLTCTNAENDMKHILDIVAAYDIEEIVVGMPYNLNGTEGPQVKKTREIMDRIGSRTGVPVREWDERLSTLAAEKVLLEADMSRAKRRKVIDKVAAVIILQGYLDRLSYKDFPS